MYMVYMSDIGHKSTIDLLNIHATIVASEFKTTNDNFRVRFEEFIAALEAADFPSNYLRSDASSSPLFNAYWAFLNSPNTDIADITNLTNGH
jgi:hypothetical protein